MFPDDDDDPVVVAVALAVAVAVAVGVGVGVALRGRGCSHGDYGCSGDGTCGDSCASETQNRPLVTITTVQWTLIPFQ
jgi:hypothetical protein